MKPAVATRFLRAWSRANGFFRNKTDAKNALRYVRERRKKRGEEILTKPMDKLAACIETERRLSEIGISLVRRKTQSYA
jgi:hypothetical protein